MGSKGLYMKRKDEEPVWVEPTEEDPHAISRAIKAGLNECDGPTSTEDADCGCNGEEEEVPAQGSEE